MVGFFDHDEKSEAPSARRLEQARLAGKAAFSADLVGALVLIAGFCGILLFSSTIFVALSTTMSGILGNLSNTRVDGSTAGLFLYEVLEQVVVIAGPLLLLLLIVAGLSTWLQVGFRVRFAEIIPDVERVDPFRNGRRILGLEGFGKLAFGFLKIAAVGMVLWIGVRGMLFGPEAIVDIGMSDPGIAWSVAGDHLFWIFLKVCGVLLLISAADWAYRRWQYQKSMLMSRAEVKDENREVHGDPQIRRRRRQLHEQVLKGIALPDLSSARVVLTAGPSISIALRYEEGNAEAPMIIRIGHGEAAIQIKNAGLEAGIPILDDVLLATDLVNSGVEGEVIQKSLFERVTEVIGSLATPESSCAEIQSQVPRREG